MGTNQKLEEIKVNGAEIVKPMTAVEWLVIELKKYDSAGLKDQSNYVIEMPTYILTELEEQAKEIERKQITDFSNDLLAQNDVSYTANPDLAEQYYNETFKTK